MPWLQARAKPAFSRLEITRASGNDRASRSRVPSAEALSTTISSSSAEVVCARSDSRQRRRWPAPFQLAITTLTRGLSLIAGRPPRSSRRRRHARRTAHAPARRVPSRARGGRAEAVGGVGVGRVIVAARAAPAEQRDAAGALGRRPQRLQAQPRAPHSRLQAARREVHEVARRVQSDPVGAQQTRAQAADVRHLDRDPAARPGDAAQLGEHRGRIVDVLQRVRHRDRVEGALGQLGPPARRRRAPRVRARRAPAGPPPGSCPRRRPGTSRAPASGPGTCQTRTRRPAAPRLGPADAAAGRARTPPCRAPAATVRRSPRGAPSRRDRGSSSRD